MQKIDILGVAVNTLTIKQANENISKLILAHKDSESAVVVQPYVEFLVTAYHQPKIAKILNSTDLCLADGVSLQWAASYLYGEPKARKLLKTTRSILFWLQKPIWRDQIIPEKTAGATQTKALLHLAEKNGWKIGIIGGINTPKEIKSALESRFPKIEHLHVWSGFYTASEENGIVQDIASHNLDILFVAMGFPRQELFIDRYRANSLAKVLIGEGGTFDYSEMGGPINRAPLWMQKTGLEWLWRLLKQPKRIGRQLAIPKFIYLVKKQSKKL